MKVLVKVILIAAIGLLVFLCWKSIQGPIDFQKQKKEGQENRQRNTAVQLTSKLPIRRILPDPSHQPVFFRHGRRGQVRCGDKLGGKRGQNHHCHKSCPYHRPDRPSGTAPGL